MYCGIITNKPPFDNFFSFTTTSPRTLFGLSLSFPDKSTVVISGSCSSNVWIGVNGGSDSASAGSPSWSQPILSDESGTYAMEVITDIPSNYVSFRNATSTAGSGAALLNGAGKAMGTLSYNSRIGLRISAGIYSGNTVRIMMAKGNTYKNFVPYGKSLFDITPFIAYQGWKVSRNDIDGQNAGRNIEGTMIRDLVTSKRRIDVTLIPIAAGQLSEVLKTLSGETLDVMFDDVELGRVTKKMYSNNFSWTYCMKSRDDLEYYNGLTFPLIEV